MPEFVLPGEADRCPHCGAVLYDPPACCDRMTKEWVEAELARLDAEGDPEYLAFMEGEYDEGGECCDDQAGCDPVGGAAGGHALVPGRNGVGEAGGRVPCPACHHDERPGDAAAPEGVAGAPGGGGEDSWRRTAFGLALILIILAVVVLGFVFLAAAVYGAGHRDGKLEAYHEAEVKGAGVWAPDPRTHDMGFQFVGPPRRN